MTWVKGKSGNPSGRRAEKSWKEDLELAIRKARTEKGFNLLEHCVKQAQTDNRMAIELLKKFIPDMKHIDANVKMDMIEEFRSMFAALNRANKEQENAKEKPSDTHDTGN
jgi:hypothetical protein